MTSSNSSKSSSKGDQSPPLPFIREGKEGIYLLLSLQPRSSKNEIVGILNNTLKIKLTAPPVESAANAACIAFLSDMLGIKKSQIEITSGKKSRLKQVIIQGTRAEEVAGKLIKILDSAAKR